ncbi:hypothetical protein F5X96DRAFT_624561 [Biscogniauxia mediterranea]|nr:hypothetical protein F5X96DRAFT_624561 [Biscogniauxia mediterranea]
MGNIAALFSILAFLATLVSQSFAAPAPVPQPQGLPPTNDGIFPICHCAQERARKRCCYGGEWGKNCIMVFDPKCVISGKPPHLPSGNFTQALGVNTTFITSIRALNTPTPPTPPTPPKITWKWPSITHTHTISVLPDTIWPIPGLPTRTGTQTISNLAHMSSFSPSPLTITDTRTLRVPTDPVTSSKSLTGRSSSATDPALPNVLVPPFPPTQPWFSATVMAIPTPPIESTVPGSVTTRHKDPVITVTTLHKDPIITVTTLAKEPIFSTSVLAPSPSPSLVERGVEEVVKVVQASPKDNTTAATGKPDEKTCACYKGVPFQLCCKNGRKIGGIPECTPDFAKPCDPEGAAGDGYDESLVDGE